MSAADDRQISAGRHSVQWPGRSRGVAGTAGCRGGGEPGKPRVRWFRRRVAAGGVAAAVAVCVSWAQVTGMASRPVVPGSGAFHAMARVKAGADGSALGCAVLSVRRP